MSIQAPCRDLPDALSILIAMPHRDMAATIATMLRGLSIKTIREANDSVTARRLLERQPFHAMILDNALAPDDGLTLVRDLRASKAMINTALPVILISAAAERSHIEAARDAGITEFARLPVSADILRTRLCAAVVNPRPFVDAPGYAGPDRRRRTTNRSGPERRGA